MLDLKAKLLKAGLVTEDQVEKAEAEQEAERAKRKARREARAKQGGKGKGPKGKGGKGKGGKGKGGPGRKGPPPSPQSEGLYGAHFWVIPGSLGLFSCQGAFGQRILISPKLDLVLVRLGHTAAEKVSAAIRHCKQLVNVFRPTA